MERGKKRNEKKEKKQLQAVRADAKRGWQNTEQIFMDPERKNEKTITHTHTHSHIHTLTGAPSSNWKGLFQMTNLWMKHR